MKKIINWKVHPGYKPVVQKHGIEITAIACFSDGTEMAAVVFLPVPYTI